MALDRDDLLKKIRAFLAEHNHSVPDFLEHAMEEHNQYLVSPDYSEEQYAQDVRGGRYAFEAMFAARMEALFPGQTQGWHSKNTQIWLARDVINAILERSKVNSFDADGLWWSFRHATYPFTKDDLHMIALLCMYGPLWCLMKGQARPSDVFANTTPALVDEVGGERNKRLEGVSVEGDMPHGCKEYQDGAVRQKRQVVEEETVREDGEIADEEVSLEEGEIVGEEDLNPESPDGAVANTPDYDPFFNKDSEGTKEIDYSIESFQVKEQGVKDFGLDIEELRVRAFRFKLPKKSKQVQGAGPQGKPKALELDKPDVETLGSHLVESLSLFVHSENCVFGPPEIRSPQCNEPMLVISATQLKTEGWVGDKIWYFLLHNLMANYCQNWKSVEFLTIFAALTTNPTMAVLANAGNILPLNRLPKEKFSIHTLATFFEGFISIATKTNPGSLLVWMDSSLPPILDHLQMKCAQYGLVGLTPSTSCSSLNYAQELRDLIEDQSNPRPLPYSPSPGRRRATIFSTVQWSETSSSTTTPIASPRKGLLLPMPVPVESANLALTPYKRKHSETNDLPPNGDEQTDIVNPMGEEQGRPSQKAKSSDISDSMNC